MPHIERKSDIAEKFATLSYYKKMHKITLCNEEKMTFAFLILKQSVFYSSFLFYG